MILREYDEPIVSPGLQQEFAQGNFPKNAQHTHESAAQYTFELNQPIELENRFLRIKPLYAKTTSDGSRVVTHDPTGPYGAGGAQVTAVRPEIVEGREPERDKDGRVLTKTIFDFEEPAREEYFRQILATLGAVREALKAIRKDNYKVIFTENTVTTVSTLEHRTSRTIADPHTQIFAVPESTVPFDRADLPATLGQEARIVRLLTARVNRALQQFPERLDYPQALIEAMGIRNAPPFGYVIETQIREEWPLVAQVDGLTEILTKQRQLYAEVIQELMQVMIQNQTKYQHLLARLIPQPSYRTFGSFNAGGRLELSFAPIFISPAGVMEALHRPVERGPHNINLFGRDPFEAEQRKAQHYEYVSYLIRESLMQGKIYENGQILPDE